MSKMLWIDDEETRRDLAERIAGELNLDCVYQSLHAAHSTMRGPMLEFGAIFIDHFLTQDIQGRNAGSNKGASLCSELRVCCPGTPIFGISAASDSQISLNERLEYDLFATESAYADLRSSGQLKSVVDGFARLKTLALTDGGCEGQSFVDIVLKQFGVPSDDLPVMKKILPSCLRSRETYDIHRAFQWVSKKFLRKNGVLIGTKNIAAMIGLKEVAFVEKVKAKLHNCRYQGVFSYGDDIFWRSLVFARLANLTGNNGSIPLSHYCEKLEGVSDEDCEVCARCNKKYTEVLAYEDRTQTANPFPAHFDCSIEVEEGQSLFFDPDYLLKESVEDA